MLTTLLLVFFWKGKDQIHFHKLKEYFLEYELVEVSDLILVFFLPSLYALIMEQRRSRLQRSWVELNLLHNVLN